MRALHVVALAMAGVAFSGWLLSRPEPSSVESNLCGTAEDTSEEEHLDIAHFVDRVLRPDIRHIYNNVRDMNICRVDFDRDGEREAFVEIVAPGFCGTAGCPVLVIQWRAGVPHLVDKTFVRGFVLGDCPNGEGDREQNNYHYCWDHELPD